MPQVAVGKEAGKKIRALIGNTGAVIAHAREQALAVEKEHLDRVLREYWQQNALEKQLDEVIDRAMKGLTAVIEFGRLPEVQSLVRARSAIRKETPFYEAKDDEAGDDGHTRAALLYTKKAVQFVITGSRESLVQGVGQMTRYTDCEMKCSFPLTLRNQKLRFRRAWLRHFFLQNFEMLWYDHEVEYNEWEVMKDRSSVDEFDLRNFASISPLLALAGKWDKDGDWYCNHVLIRVLCDCVDPKKLRQYFCRTLAQLD